VNRPGRVGAGPVVWPPRRTRLPRTPTQHQDLFGSYPQQPAFFATGAAGADPHPHPEPPVAFTSASRAQQASVPVGAGPPQHVFGAAWSWAVEALGRDAFWVVMRSVMSVSW
jgi:hypothetical protein